MIPEIKKYHESKPPERRVICERLCEVIAAEYGFDECKLWHGAPVWFIDGNPIVGYHNLKAGIRLMFWSGQSFDVPGLDSTGTFKAACKSYKAVSEINPNEIQSWLTHAREVQWDYKNIMKNRGLRPLKGLK